MIRGRKDFRRPAERTKASLCFPMKAAPGNRAVAQAGSAVSTVSHGVFHRDSRCLTGALVEKPEAD